jgi:hypothetical protein
VPENQRDQIAEALLDTQERVGDAVSQGLTRDPTMGRLSGEAERKLFWQRAISPQEEQHLWAQGLDPWEISTRVFPKRWQLLPLGRTTDTEKVAWLKKHQQLGPPESEPTESDDSADSVMALPAPLPSSLGTPSAPAAGMTPGPQAAGSGYPSIADPALGYE